MLIFTHISLVLSIAFFIFAYTLLRDYKNSGFHKSNAFLIISFGLFFFVNSLLALSNNQEEAKIYSRFLFTSHFIVPFIIESLFYITDQKTRLSKLTRRLFIFTPFMVLAFLEVFFPGLTLDLPEITKFGWVYVNKTEAGAFMLYPAVYIVAIVGLLYMSVSLFLKTQNKREKNFLLLFLISYLSPVAIFIAMTYFFKNGTNYNIPFLTISGLVAFSLILIFIKRYSIFDISLGITTNDILLNISNMLFLLDKHGNLVETNLIAQNTLQLKSNKNLNFNFFTLIREKIKIEDIITSTLQGKEFRVSIMVQPSHTIPVSLSASKLEKKGQFIGYIVLATDLSGEQKLNDEKRAYELEIKAMQSQMNPNFILNSLSSVNSLLDKGDDGLSKQYISKLADLFKMILEQTGEHLITVEEEIDILETYLQIEKQRFENKFTYEIQTAEDCELSLFEIPPMIVQPFVENAILHGFTRSDQNKLTIIFSGDEERFNIVVKDNGVGISTRKNMLQDNNHRGIATIRERLSLYNKYSNGYQSTLTVVNNKDLDHSTTGTTVTISFKKNLKLVENLKLMAN